LVEEDIGKLGYVRAMGRANGLTKSSCKD